MLLLFSFSFIYYFHSISSEAFDNPLYVCLCVMISRVTFEIRFIKDLHSTLNALNDNSLCVCVYVGPIDDSCWVIPGMLSVGGIPYGQTERKSSVSSVTEIMLSGVNIFVSLLREEEEMVLQKIRDDPKNSIEKMIFSDHRKARYSIGSTIADTKVLLFDYRSALDGLNEMEITAENEVTLAQRRMRIIGRIKVMSDRLKKGEQQQKKLPNKVEWIRIPMNNSTAQNVNDILPALWELERRIAL